jgi:hypothetical protein
MNVTRRACATAAAVLASLRRRPALTTGLIWACVLLFRLYYGGAVGLADNFDGHRLMCQLGVAPHPMAAGQSLWAYTTPRYDAYTWYGESCGAGGTGQPYLSTAVIPLWIAKALTATVGNHVLALPGALDLRMLGLVYAALAATAIGWCAHELPGRTWLKVLVASGIGLVVVDSAFAPDFISPYADPAGIIGILFLLPALLRLLRVERLTWREPAAVVLIAAWTIGAEAQLSTVLVAALPCLLARPAALPRFLRRIARPRIVAGFFGRIPGAVLCAGLALFALGYQQTQSRWLYENNLYNSVFGDLLDHSSHVTADLRALHLAPGLAASVGSDDIAARNSPADTALYPDFLAHASYSGELSFYADHPWRLFGVADRGLDGVSAARPDYLGNFPADAGHPAYAQECRVCVVEAAFTLAEPLRWFVFPALWLGALIAGLVLAVRGRARPEGRSAGGVLAALAAATIAQFWFVMLTEGDSDLAKNMVFTNLGTCLLGPLLIAALVGLDLSTEPAVPVAACLPSQPDPAGADADDTVDHLATEVIR